MIKSGTGDEEFDPLGSVEGPHSKKKSLYLQIFKKLEFFKTTYISVHFILIKISILYTEVSLMFNCRTWDGEHEIEDTPPKVISVDASLLDPLGLKSFASV